MRALAARHGIRPAKAFGQHFLVDPNVARAIAALADLAPERRVVEIGAGLGSLTVALAATGAHVLAVEFDRTLLPALREVTAPLSNVDVLAADAMAVDWPAHVSDGEWDLVANLPYNIATPLLLDLLEHVPAIRRFLVMVQREVGERVVARAGDAAYGAPSVKVAYRADARLVRRIPSSVFWPRPRVESVLVRLTRRDPPVAVNPRVLFRVVDEGFAERRKTMRNALRRLGLDGAAATEALAECGLDEQVRAEDLDLERFACVAEAVHGAVATEPPRG